MRELYYKTGNAFLVVYALDDPQSYPEAIEIMQKIRMLNQKNVSRAMFASLVVDSKIITFMTTNFKTAKKERKFPHFYDVFGEFRIPSNGSMKGGTLPAPRNR